MTTEDRLGVAVVGAGYWGPNLVRNAAGSGRCDLLWVCDIDADRAAAVAAPYRDVRSTGEIDDVLDDPRVEAVAVATPAATHTELGLRCLDAGKHLLVEKPLAPTVAEAEKLVARAAEHDLVLMCDHTYCYTPAVTKIAELIADGALGDIHYVDSTRVNLGIVQSDVDVIWDLAPHDLSILDHVLPTEHRPVGVAAVGADPVGAGVACVGHLSIPLTGNAFAHAHVNWLSPTKIRQMIIGGSRRMLVWDDLAPTQRVSVFDRGVDMQPGTDPQARLASQVSYRLGDMVAPALDEREALTGVVHELCDAVRNHRQPRTDGEAGLRVLRLLEAATDSLARNGELVAVP